MDIDSAYNLWAKHRGNRGGRVQEAIELGRKAFSSVETRDDTWIESALQDDDRKWFAAAVLAPSVPRRFLPAMIRAAVYERDPSCNRQFIEPCVRSYGGIRVQELLNRYLKDGTNFEKAGAVNAMYWAQALAEGQKDAATLPHHDLLREFIENNDVDVRRSIVSKLQPGQPELYPEEHRALIREAVRIAREHDDAYIRHRIEVQLGASDTLPALPHRGD